MTAPTQQLPSWLSLSTSLATNAAGQPTATFTTLLTLPLTYFGPSIPLGSDGVWVYGGSSSPAPSSSLSSSFTNSGSWSGSTQTFSTFATPSATPSVTPSATPSATPSITSAPFTTSPTSVSTLVSSSPTTSSILSSSTPSSLPVSGQTSSHSHLSRVIIGSVLGSVLGSLLLLFLLICLLRKRQRNQRQRNRRPEPPMGQVMWMWHDVHRHDDDQDADLDAQLRSPDEASPQSSGDERDAFLRRSADAPEGSKDGEPTARLVDAPRTSHDSSGPIGIALAAGNKVIASHPFVSKSGSSSMGNFGYRRVISREQLADAYPGLIQSHDLLKSPEDAELGPDTPLLPPPTVNLNVSHGSRKSLLPSERSMTPGNDPESALLYTAQRVQVGKSTRSSSGSPWPEAVGIPSIVPRSWLTPTTRSATPTTPSTKSSLVGRQLTDAELEAGRSLNTQLRSEMGYRDGLRPVSGVSGVSTGSARSGNTIFYDAQSREDLSHTPPPVPLLPQGTTSTGRSGHAGPSPLSATPIAARDESEGPPAYEPTPPSTGNPVDAVDYLDVPIPRPASPFASVSSAKQVPALPGLTLPDPHVWRDSATAPSDASGGINIELLEEEPPAARESWRQISQVFPGLHDRRMTFGIPLTVVNQREPTVSEQGSLHSMRSHLSPHSALSASGSAPAASNSDYSRGFMGSSLKSLTHSSSISSTDRRLVRPNPGEVSPALSAIGRPLAAVSPSLPSLALPQVPPAAAPQLVQSATITSTTTTRSSVTTHTSLTDPITGEVSRLAHPAWTGGRDSFEHDVSPPTPPPSSWGGGWSSPSHLRILQNRVGGRDGMSHA